MTNLQAFGDNLISQVYPNTMKLSIQSAPDKLNLIPPQDRQIHLKFFDANTTNPIENVTFVIYVTKGNQTFLQSTFWTQSGSFTLNLQPGKSNLWIPNPDHDPIDGLYYSKGAQIDIWTPYLTEDVYHFSIQPVVINQNDLRQQNVGGKFTTDLNFLSTYNETLTPHPNIMNSVNQLKILSPLKQFKSGTASKDVTCRQDLLLIFKSSNEAPICVKPDNAKKLESRGWAISQYHDPGAKSKIKLYDYSYDGIDKDNGMVSINNQTFYQTTLGYSAYDLPKKASTSFHDVVFAFPQGTLNTPGASFVMLDMKFHDGFEEIYGGTALDQNGTATKFGGIPIPTQYGPRVATDSITILGNHTMPQAGITIYHDKIKLLVSINNQISTSTNYTESKVADDATYLSQTVDEWKSKTPEQLRAYYEKYKDAFYDQLGSFLIKDEMKKELVKQKIQNIHDDFQVFPGMTLDSLPPHIGYDAVVNATDGNSYLLLGGVFANQIESLKITKLVFDKDALNSLSTGKRPSYANPFANTHVDNSTSQEKLQIAGTYVEESDIPWTSVGTGNYGVVEISLYTSVYHMIPDAQKYYTARALQLIPFYIQVKILPPPPTEKELNTK